MINIKIVNDTLNKKGLKILIINKNDQEIDISWHCAITGKHKSKKHDLMSAMRIAIDKQINDYRINNKKNNCKLCNTDKDLDVDHSIEEESAFDQLVVKFLESYNILKENLPNKFAELNDNTHRRCFLQSDVEFEEKWIKYHKEHAKLRMLCHMCNIRQKKTKKKLQLD